MINKILTKAVGVFWPIAEQAQNGHKFSDEKWLTSNQMKFIYVPLQEINNLCH